MKSKKKIIHELSTSGISIIDNFFGEEYCAKAICEIDELIESEKDKVYSVKDEDTSGDQRLFKIENKSNTARQFQQNEFINSVLNSVSKKKIKSYFILGGKLTHNTSEIKNSGGGWHRDSDLEQFKAMVYLNDVDSSNGPFLFLKNSDQFDLERRENLGKVSLKTKIFILLGKLKKHPPRYDDMTVENYLIKSETKPTQVTGSKGTLVLFNSTYLHRGKNIEKGIRYTFTNYMFTDNLLSRYSRKKQFQSLFIK